MSRALAWEPGQLVPDPSLPVTLSVATLHATMSLFALGVARGMGCQCPTQGVKRAQGPLLLIAALAPVRQAPVHEGSRCHKEGLLPQTALLGLSPD